MYVYLQKLKVLVVTDYQNDQNQRFCRYRDYQPHIQTILGPAKYPDGRFLRRLKVPVSQVVGDFRG